MSIKTISIAIDGPVGAGKGTLAVALAKKINALYIYTGAMYRELALACVRKRTDINNEQEVMKTLGSVSIELKNTDYEVRAFLNGEDVSNEIFKPSISKLVPVVAAFPKVRGEMVIRQKKAAKEAMEKGKNVVMEGRDIATDVLRDADIKIHLTADVGVRAERRLKQLEARGIEVNFEEVLKAVKERDKHDTERIASPMGIAENAMIIDTTNDTIDQTVDKVIKKLKEKSLI